MEMNTSMSHIDSLSSPNRVSITSLAVNFYRVSSSPTTGLTTTVPSVQDLGRKSGDSYISLSDFEFETGQQAMDEQQKQNQQHGEDLPPMSFADELFSNGQVMPLKLPPRLQYANSERYSNRSPNGSSPTSPKSVLKGHFFRRSFRKTTERDDFDPFMIALDNVRKEDRGRELPSSHRRARSLSPLRNSPQWSINSEDSAQKKRMGFSQPLKCEGLNTGEQTEPKKKTSAKSVVHIRSYRDRPTKPTLPVNEPSDSINKNDTKKSKSSRGSKGSKRFSFRETLFRSKSEGTAALKDPNGLRSSSFRSMHWTHYNEKKEEADGLSKKAFITYKAPCMLVCLGFGKKGLRNLN